MKTTINQKVAAFDKVLGLCGTLGSRYQPTKESINPSGLQETLQRAKQTMDLVNVWWEANTSAISERAHLYAMLPVFSTRVINSLRLAGASQEVIEDAMMLKRRFYYRKPAGKRVSASDAESDQTRKGNSSVQLDYLSITELFEKLVYLVTKVPAYATNESDLTIEALNQHLASLRQASDNVRATQIQLEVARSRRDETLRAMTKEAGDVKRYVRTAFGHTSPEFKMLTKIRFH
ncbi:MAG TPA: hypothetical protein VD927_10985 [Chryseosolibacter sp.]|nr:hypothetical protein [Chryseosolibacter sp.]